MLRVADIWERAIHTPALAVDISGDAPGEVIIIRAGSSYDGKGGDPEHPAATTQMAAPCGGVERHGHRRRLAHGDSFHCPLPPVADVDRDRREIVRRARAAPRAADLRR